MFSFRYNPKCTKHYNDFLKFQINTEELTKQIRISLAAKTVQSPSLPLQGVDHIHGSNRLPPSMLRVGNCITNDIFKEDLQHASGLFIDQAADSLHASSSGQPPDRRLGDALDVVPENLTVALCSAFPQPLSSLSAAGHFSPCDGCYLTLIQRCENWKAR
ncbi:unnamed protein product, partial [Cuscuta epithymum]